MRVVLALALLVLLFLGVLPLTMAQQHEHGGNASGIVIAHDVPPSGRTYAGNINHFAILDLGVNDLVPDFHQQNHVRVTWNGLVLYETTADSGHDYDGVYAFDVVFPGPGQYEVAAIDDAGAVLNMFMGTVVAPKAGSGADLTLDGPATVDVGEPATFTFSTVANGTALVEHSDALFEVRQGTALVFRTKTHTHDAAQSVQYAFPLPGTYTVRVTNFLSYPSGNEQNEFAPKVVEMTVMATPGPAPSALPPATAVPPTDMNFVATGTASDATFQLLGTYDPYTIVGPNTLQHLSALVMDPATGEPVQHVDFTANLRGPTGAIFSSDTLHEYDGIFEVAAVEPVPGVYLLTVDASRGDWTGHLEMAYVVAPPIEPVALDVPPQPSALAAIYTVDGLTGAVAGIPMQLKISARGLAGQPFPHSELEAQFLDAAGVPLLATKLHTHSDGDFPFTATLLAAGQYTLRISPFPLDPQATPFYYGTAIGGSLDFPVTVAPGAALPAPTGDMNSEGAAQESGAPTFIVLVAALGLARFAGRR